MLKLAVIGAGTLLGRELVQALETRECSVVPLTAGPMTPEQEDGDLVVFAPETALLEGLDLVILAETPDAPDLLEGFPGRILDLRDPPDPALDPMPLAGGWPAGKTGLCGRPALEQVLATLPRLVGGIGAVAGTHLQSVASLGNRGVDGLMEQTAAIFRGEDPDPGSLGYRAAFEVVPTPPRGRLITVKVPVFHGDLLILHLQAAEGQALERLAAPAGVEWQDAPPSSREVAVSPMLLAHFALVEDGRAAVLTLGFDPILWGVLVPTLRLLEL
jgi:aspartate-semialdehyde dehydrogenase